MDLFKNKKLIFAIGLFIIVELFSYLGFIYSLVNQSTFIVLAVLGAILSLYRLEFGLLMLISELFISSFGYLFYLDLDGHKLSLRIVLWTIVMFVFAVKFFYQILFRKQKSPYLEAIKKFKFLKYFLYLLGFIVLAIVNGLLRGHNLNYIFSDSNAWLYFLLIFLFIVVYANQDGKASERLKLVFFAAIIFISLQTLFLLFVFSHNLSFAPDVYLWLRRNLIGEMTATASGWPRVFLQTQIFSAIGFLILFWLKGVNLSIKKLFTKNNLGWQFLAGFFLSTVLISFSRSFWLALILALIFSLVYIYFVYSFKDLLKSLLWLFSSLLISFALVYCIAAFPYPPTGGFKADFIDRISNGSEAAISSRWSQLPILFKEIIKEPFFAQGYGKTITYLSSDPRVLANNPSGEYTTYAFEWGYLDMILKFGLFGLSIYLLLLFKIIKQGLKKIKNSDYLSVGISFGLLFLVFVNIFTPYLNHPLGIGFLLLSSCLISKDRVY